MKIAVFGWYGHDNAGDERIKFCLNHFLMGLGGINKVDFFDLHENGKKGKTNKFDCYDLVIIGGGGLILSRCNYHDFILGIKTKIITAGISVETELKGNPGKFAKALLEKSVRFMVRDQGSYEKLATLDVNRKVIVSADLTFLKPFSPVDTQSNTRIGVNLLAKIKPTRINSSFLLLLNKLGVRHYPATVCFQKMVDDFRKLYDIFPIPLYCVEQDSNSVDCNDVNFMRKYFEFVPNNFNDEYINKAKIFISMRLHGLIFSVQKCIPPIAFSIYPKQINFMKEIGLTEFLVDVDDVGVVISKVEMALKVESDIKSKVSAYRDKASQIIIRDFIAAMNLL